MTQMYFPLFSCFVNWTTEKTPAKAVRNLEKQCFRSRCERKCNTDGKKNAERLPYIPGAPAVIVSHWGRDRERRCNDTGESERMFSIGNGVYHVLNKCLSD